MFIPLSEIVARYGVKISGVLHVGAHLAEERDEYAAHTDHVVWVEALASKAKEIDSVVPPTHRVVCAVVDEESGRSLVFHIANNWMSSSIFELGSHQLHYPDICYTNHELRKTTALKEILDKDADQSLNFLVLDVQGAELRALRGLGDRLGQFDYVYTEVFREPLYVGCSLAGEIEAYLSDFVLMEVRWTPHGWGNAFFVRRQIQGGQNLVFAEPFDGDRYIQEAVRELVGQHGFKSAVETGTYWGATTAFFARLVRKVHTIEINPDAYARTSAALARFAGVRCWLGNSPQVLSERVLPGLTSPALFYLDAHWQEYWPLRDELKAIVKARVPKPVVLIHDFKVPGRDFGYDSYGGKDLDYEYVADLLPLIYPEGFQLRYNDRAEGSYRGMVYITPKR